MRTVNYSKAKFLKSLVSNKLVNFVTFISERKLKIAITIQQSWIKGIVQIKNSIV